MPIKPVTAESIYYNTYKPHPMIVEGLIPTGLTVLAGPSKIGKSWMVLDLAIAVASGTPFLGKPTRKTGVFYYCLEDTEQRIRDRMHLLADEPPDNLYFSTTTDRLGNGFIRDIVSILREHKDIELIIIDTLQKIRKADDGSGTGMYGKDYEEIGKIKELADLNDKSIIVVHHTRKLKDKSDPFNEISGSTGISGASDTNMVLRRPAETTTAELLIRGRDIEEKKFILEYVFPRWKVIEEKCSADIDREKIPPALHKIANYVRDHGYWEGSASQLIDAVGDHSIAENQVTRLITRHYYDVFYPKGISFEKPGRRNNIRIINLTYDPAKDECRMRDSCDSSDSNMPARIEPSLASLPSPVMQYQVLPP